MGDTLYSRVTAWRYTGSTLTEEEMPKKKILYKSKYPRSAKPYTAWDAQVINELLDKYAGDPSFWALVNSRKIQWDIAENIARAALALGRTTKALVCYIYVSVKRAKSNYYVRIRSKAHGKRGIPYRYRMFIAPQEKVPENGYMVVTIHRG